MTYRALWSRMWYSLFAAGLALEMLVLRAFTDAAGYAHRGGNALLASGEKQLAELPGGVE